jgi:hypothetical protein
MPSETLPRNSIFNAIPQKESIYSGPGKVG